MNTGYKVMHFLLVLMTTPGSAAKQRQRDCRQMYAQVHRHSQINNVLPDLLICRCSAYYCFGVQPFCFLLLVTNALKRRLHKKKPADCTRTVPYIRLQWTELNPPIPHWSNHIWTIHTLQYVFNKKLIMIRRHGCKKLNKIRKYPTKTASRVYLHKLKISS